MPRDNKHIQPLHTRLPSLAPPLAQLSRYLFDHRSAALAAPLDLALLPDHGPTPAKGADLLNPAVPADPTAPANQASPASIQLRGADGGLTVLIDLLQHPALESAALAPSACWRTALAEALLQPQLERLRELGLPALSVAAFEALPAGQAERALAGGLRLRLQAGQSASSLIITDIDNTLLAALERTERPMLALPDWLAALPLAGAAVLGERRCAAALLASLRAGDVLLGWRGGVSSIDTLPGVTLRWGAPQGLHFRAPASIAARRLALDSFPTLSLEPEPMDTNTPQEGGAASDIGALELPVTLEIATLAMPLQQIGAMQPGQVLALPLALSDARVRLVSCGQTLGHGSLVVVGEQLGFQLNAMVNADEPDA